MKIMGVGEPQPCSDSCTSAGVRLEIAALVPLPALAAGAYALNEPMFPFCA